MAAVAERSVLRRREDDCGGKIRTAAQHSRVGIGVGRVQIKDQAERRERSMASSHYIEAAFFFLTVVVLCTLAAAVLAFAGVCRLALDLQERVSVRGTPIVTRVKFSKCRLK